MNSVVADGRHKALMLYQCGLCGERVNFAVVADIHDGVPTVNTPDEAHWWARSHVSPKLIRVLIYPRKT